MRKNALTDAEKLYVLERVRADAVSRIAKNANVAVQAQKAAYIQAEDVPSALTMERKPQSNDLQTNPKTYRETR